MAIKIGDTLPVDIKLKEMAEGGPKDVTVGEIFKGKKVVLFAVPGAFTPTCSMKHLPGFLEQANAIRAKGVDEIVCLAVNDAFVMGAWGKASNAQGKVRISKMVPGVGEEALAILEPGSYFGEMALIDDTPRSADATAHLACTLYVIQKADLEELMFLHKDLAYELLWTFVRTLSSRLRETNDKIRSFFALSSFGPR